MAPNRLIATSTGGSPWCVPEVLQLFKQFTEGKTVVVGRKTYEIRNKAIKGCDNVVLTRDPSWWADDVTVINKPEQLAGVIDLHKDIYIIGGREIYTEFLPNIEELYTFTIYQPVKEEPYGIYFPEFIDKFDHYLSVKKYDEFEYGVWYKEEGFKSFVPTFSPRVRDRGYKEPLPELVINDK